MAGGTVAGVVAHVAAGHAGAGSWPTAIAVGSQSAHFAAAGVWLGGLAALLLGLPGAPSRAKAETVRRFSLVAAGGIVVVAVAGTLRAVDELDAWSDLWSGAYGRAIAGKVALLGLIAALAVRSRRRARSAGKVGKGTRGGGAAGALRSLQRTSRGELVLAAAAIALAAVLGTVAPPVTGATAEPRLTASAGRATLPSPSLSPRPTPSRRLTGERGPVRDAGLRARPGSRDPSARQRADRP